jgi:hypothetical protein
MIVEIRDEVVSLSGTLRQNHWQTLESAILIRLRQHPSGIVLDCSRLDSITEEGARTFAEALDHFEGRVPPARLVFAAIPPAVLKVLRRVPDLGSRLPVAETVEAARVSLGLSPVPPSRAGAGGDVVIGLLGTRADEHAVALGLRLASTSRPEEPRDGISGAPPRVHLAYLLAVPRDRPLLSAMGAEEEAAIRNLRRFEEAARRRRLTPLARLERTRNPADRLVGIGRDFRASCIVLSVEQSAPLETLDLVERVVNTATCDVLVNRLSANATFTAEPETAPDSNVSADRETDDQDAEASSTGEGDT